MWCLGSLLSLGALALLSLVLESWSAFDDGLLGYDCALLNFPEQYALSQKQTPTNFSDDALVYGSEACGLLAGYLSWGDGLVFAFVAACQGLILGAVLLFVGLMLVRQPPGIFYRLKNGEPIDDVPELLNSEEKSVADESESGDRNP